MIKSHLSKKILVVLLAVPLLIITAWVAGNSPSPGTPSPIAHSPEGSFIPTETQWQALKTEAVKAAVFKNVTFAEGKIALNGNKTTPVYSPFSGRIVRLVASPGEQVKKQEPLLEIEAAEFSQNQNDLASALSNAATSRTQEHVAEVKEQRQHELFLAKAAAKQDWEQSRTDLEAARNARHTAEVALSLVKSKLHLLGSTEGEISALANTNKMNGRTTIGSPIDGTVIDRQASPGQFINSLASGATTPLFTISDLSTLWLIGNIRETDVTHVHVGDVVELQVLAYPQEIFKAIVTYISSSVDASTHRLQVRAEVVNPDERLKPEMFASFTILDGKEATAPQIPESAVVYEGEKAHVWAVSPERAITLRDIRVGRVQNGRVEVEDGLKAGDSIVTSGALFIDRAVKNE